MCIFDNFNLFLRQKFPFLWLDFSGQNWECFAVIDCCCFYVSLHNFAAQPAPSTSKETFFDQYLPVLFELSDELVSLIGSQWFESDPDFLLLLSSMSSIRLQEVFHEQVVEFFSPIHICFCIFGRGFAESLTHL